MKFTNKRRTQSLLGSSNRAAADPSGARSSMSFDIDGVYADRPSQPPATYGVTLGYDLLGLRISRPAPSPCQGG